MKIHACLMTQNEQSDLEKNVALLLPHVDSITVVDGGSIDGTIPYMRNLSRAEGKVRFFIHPWRDNFPEQRNHYLDHAAEIANDGDMILVADPDEYFAAETLASLRRLAELVPKKREKYRSVSFRCRSVTLRGQERVYVHDDDYYKPLYFRWAPGLRYTHHGEGAVHETLHGIGPTYTTGHHPEFPALFYEHRKQENVTWPRGVRNYFIGGGGPNLGRKNPRWVELRILTDRLGLQSWQEMYKYLVGGQIAQELKDWIIKYRRETGWDGSSEQREWYKTYFRLLHPEEEPAELRFEVLE